MPADWYQDPAKVGELRYYDGTQWTEHVTISGVQTTAPFEIPEPVVDTGEPEPEPEPAPAPAEHADPTSAPSLTVTRAAQRRSEEERALEVVGAAGALGRFVTLLDGAPGYRFENARGEPVLSVSKPGLKNLVEVVDPAGRPIGAISKIGRLHSRYDIARADTGEIATVKLVTGAIDEWNLHIGDSPVATISRTSTSPADSLDLASVKYDVTVVAAIDDDLRRLLLAVPLAIDILDTQAV
jgi:hypothetical protein